MKATGIKTANNTEEIAKTENETSFAPSKEARNGSIPLSIFFIIFSITTIASSINIPIARVSPISVKRFKSYPKASIIAKVPITEVGIAKAETKVAVTFRKNKNTIITARNAPKIRSNLTLLILTIIFSDWSCRILISVLSPASI